MTSMTTLFHVGPGPEEFVEFNESYGSKAFLEHVWNEQATPLKQSGESHDQLNPFQDAEISDLSPELAGSQLHSAKARISKTSPPHIEFPTILRIKGKGNSYKFSGRWISWDDLSARNPLAVKAPPSLDEFIARGGQVGHGKAISPGGWLGADNALSAGSLAQKAQNALKESRKTETLTGSGSKESIYAPGALAPLVVDSDTPQASTPKKAANHAAEIAPAAAVPASSPPSEKKKGASQIEAMLERLRIARTGLGSGASKWANPGAGIEVLKQEADKEREEKTPSKAKEAESTMPGSRLSANGVAAHDFSEAKDVAEETPTKGKSSRRGAKSRSKEKEEDHATSEDIQPPAKSLFDRLEPRASAPASAERVEESFDESHDDAALHKRKEKKRGRRGDKHSKESMSASASMELASLASSPNDVEDEAHWQPASEPEAQTSQPSTLATKQQAQPLKFERPKPTAESPSNQDVSVEPEPEAPTVLPEPAAEKFVILSKVLIRTMTA